MKRQDLEKLRKQGYFVPTDKGYFLSMLRTEFLIHRLNKTPIWNIPKRNFILNRLIGKMDGKPLAIQNSFRVSSGKYISIGKNFFANFNCCILDRADITIGNNVYLGPNVIITSIGHPMNYMQRKMFYYSNSFEPLKRTSIEKTAPVVIGNDVWLCSGAIVCPGVTIGDNSVIGAGSVVTKDIPPNSLAYGVPCKVIREITEEDKLNLPEDINTILKERTEIK